MTDTSKTKKRRTINKRALWELYQKRPNTRPLFAAARFGVTVPRLYCVMKMLEIPWPNPMIRKLPRDDDEMRELLRTVRWQDIADRYDASITAVYQKAKRLGFVRQPEHLHLNGRRGKPKHQLEAA